jgi:hypothetical protein
MGSHSINLAIRFILELSALAAVGMWAVSWTRHVAGFSDRAGVNHPDGQHTDGNWWCRSHTCQ